MDEVLTTEESQIEKIVENLERINEAIEARIGGDE